MKKKVILMCAAVSGLVNAQITHYTDQYGQPVGAAIQQGNMTFYTDGQGRPIGSAIGAQPSTPPHFQPQQQSQQQQPQSQSYTGPRYSPDIPSRYVPKSIWSGR